MFVVEDWKKEFEKLSHYVTQLEAERRKGWQARENLSRLRWVARELLQMTDLNGCVERIRALLKEFDEQDKAL